MDILVLVAHPDSRSFNHAIAATCTEALRMAGHDVHYHDLYAERFDPVLTAVEIPKGATLDEIVEKHCAELAAAEGIVVVHPNWWGQPPAVLKGWIDRVVRPGVAYRFDERDSGEGVPVGLLRAEAALVFNTSNTEPDREKQVFGDPLESLWRNCIFGLCGVTRVLRHTFGVVVTSTAEQRQMWLRQVAEVTASVFPPQVR